MAKQKKKRIIFGTSLTLSYNGDVIDTTETSTNDLPLVTKDLIGIMDCMSDNLTTPN